MTDQPDTTPAPPAPIDEVVARLEHERDRLAERGAKARTTLDEAKRTLRETGEQIEAIERMLNARKPRTRTPKAAAAATTKPAGKGKTTTPAPS